MTVKSTSASNTRKLAWTVDHRATAVERALTSAGWSAQTVEPWVVGVMTELAYWSTSRERSLGADPYQRVLSRVPALPHTAAESVRIVLRALIAANRESINHIALDPQAPDIQEILSSTGMKELSWPTKVSVTPSTSAVSLNFAEVTPRPSTGAIATTGANPSTHSVQPTPTRTHRADRASPGSAVRPDAGRPPHLSPLTALFVRQ